MASKKMSVEDLNNRHEDKSTSTSFFDRVSAVSQKGEDNDFEEVKKRFRVGSGDDNSRVKIAVTEIFKGNDRKNPHGSQG